MLQRECEDCGELISQKRLSIVPNATKCVDCLELSGDTFRYKAYPTGVMSKTISSINDICRSKEQFERIKEQIVDDTSSWSSVGSVSGLSE